MLHHIDLDVGRGEAGHEVLLPRLREADNTVGGILNVAEQTHVGALVDLVQVDPELPRLGDLLCLLNKLVDDDGIVVDHDDIGVHRLDILTELVESEPLLLRVLVGGSIILDHALDRTSWLGKTGGGALKPEMKNLHQWSQGPELLEEVVGYLGISRNLLGMRRNKQEANGSHFMINNFYL